jgi:hypothetical protein
LLVQAIGAGFRDDVGHRRLSTKDVRFVPCCRGEMAVCGVFERRQVNWLTSQTTHNMVEFREGRGVGVGMVESKGTAWHYPCD